MSYNSYEQDIESKFLDDSRLHNDSVRSFAWENVNVDVVDRETKEKKCILTNSAGYVEAGKL